MLTPKENEDTGGIQLFKLDFVDLCRQHDVMWYYPALNNDLACPLAPLGQVSESGPLVAHWRQNCR